MWGFRRSGLGFRVLDLGFTVGFNLGWVALHLGFRPLSAINRRST